MKLFFSTSRIGDHVDTLLQVANICRTNEDKTRAAEFIEQAIFVLERAFHSAFDLPSGNCRLDYRAKPNRALFIALFQHAYYLCEYEYVIFIWIGHWTFEVIIYIYNMIACYMDLSIVWEVVDVDELFADSSASVPAERGCPRTALEVCKVLLSLDPEFDPLAVLLVIDHYALRAEEHRWLCEFFEAFQKVNFLIIYISFFSRQQY